MTLSIAAAAKLTGMKPSEIVGVDETDEGQVIAIIDGTSLISVPADRPDRDGKTGLMFLTAPLNDDGKYVGDFPVYSRLPAAEAPEEIDELAAVIAGNGAGVLAYAADHPDELEEIIAAESATAKPRKSVLEPLIEQLAERIAQ